MERALMPEHIQQHSFVVAHVALYLGGLLNQNSVRLNLELLEAGALLHDIAKARGLSTGERHEDVGARMLADWGYALLSPIVREHVVLDFAILHGPITESLIVNYADKRVKHDQVVSLSDRFSDLIGRYAKTSEHRAWLREKFDLYLQLEARIFEHLMINPYDLDCLAGKAVVSG
jgi:putative nucleotidyltransferase with HDIG domain